jgi:NAD(P)-dependent dehydrogenase (short-subunit alcohol dehydrogenase family)
MASHSSLTTAAEIAEPLLPNGLDVLIVNGAYNSNIAAYVPPTAFASASQAKVLHDEMHTSLDVNVLGTVYTINAFLALVMKGSVKKIVVISTGLADAERTVSGDGMPVMVTYSVMKAALNMVVAKFCAELKSKGLITLMLSPGVVNTKAPGMSSLLLSH